MRATPCLSKGFFGRSVEEFKRLSNIGMFLSATLTAVLLAYMLLGRSV